MPEDIVKDWDAILAAKREKSQIGPKFILNGVEFQCRRTPAATAVADLVEAAGTNRIQPAINYLGSLIVKSQREAFFAAIRDDADDDDSGMDVDFINDLLTDLSEQYAGRPTEPSSA